MVEVHAFSEAGGHPANDDAYLMRPHREDADCWLCCLADGQGGRAGGALAARLACETSMRAAERTPVEVLAAARWWRLLLPDADRAVTSETDAGFTTLAAFCVRRGQVVGASCGDSAVLLVNDRGATILTAGQLKNPPVGSGAAVFTEFTAELGRGWRVLGLTDGVWKYVGWDRVIDLARSHRGQAVLDELQSLARLPRTGAFRDDSTAVVLEEAAEPPYVLDHCSENPQ
jgi:serine/threonine protein phosphatase PrpC